MQDLLLYSLGLYPQVPKPEQFKSYNHCDSKDSQSFCTTISDYSYVGIPFSCFNNYGFFLQNLVRVA